MIQKVLDEALEYAKVHLKEGKVADYIPELAKVDPDKIGVSIVTTDGKHYCAGDWDQTFTAQSIAKTISFILAMQTAGAKKVFDHVGVEPTGDPFNSILKLELKDGKPLNPMINAGAIAVVSCIEGDDPIGQFLALARRLCRRDTIEIDQAVYRSEKATGMRNRALAYFMQSEGLIEQKVEDVLDVYFQICSLSVTTQDLATCGMILANDGIDPFTGERLVDNSILRVIKSLMVTCGLYDGSGEFAVRVGLPTKSGVGGGMMSAVEGKMGIGVFSPRLDDKGNSVCSYHMLEYISNHLKLHYFSSHN